MVMVFGFCLKQVQNKNPRVIGMAKGKCKIFE